MWKVIDSKLNRYGRHIYSCQDCPSHYMEIYKIENNTTGEIRKLCEGCLEPYFKDYEL